jgi:hypothetical protein
MLERERERDEGVGGKKEKARIGGDAEIVKQMECQ